MIQLKKIDRKYKVLNQFFVLQVVLFLLILCSLFFFEQKILPFMYFIILLLCLYLYFSIYKIYKNVSDFAVVEAEDALYKKQKQIQKEHLNAMRESEKNINECREELHKILKFNKTIAQNEQEAKDKAKELIKKYSTFYSIDYCQNKVIDAILYNKILWANTLDIKVSTKIIVPEVIHIEDIDLMFLFTNLIDNAIEACTKIDVNDRFIDIEGMVKANYLSIRVSNSKNPSIQLNTKTIQTTKEFSESHGLGIQIIKQVCKKNNGELKIEDNGSVVDIYTTLSLLS